MDRYELDGEDLAGERRPLTAIDVARSYDVPPWLVDTGLRRPRFARVRWFLRRWWPL